MFCTKKCRFNQESPSICTGPKWSMLPQRFIKVHPLFQASTSSPSSRDQGSEEVLNLDIAFCMHICHDIKKDHKRWVAPKICNFFLHYCIHKHTPILNDLIRLGIWQLYIMISCVRKIFRASQIQEEHCSSTN